MGCLIPVVFLVGGLLIGGPIGAVIGLLFSIAITMGAAKNSPTPIVTPSAIFGALIVLFIGGTVWAVTSMSHAVHDIRHPAEAAARAAEEKKQEAAEAANEAAEEAKKERKRAAMARCMGPNAIDMPPAAFQEMDRLCRQSTAGVE